jgi:hypothetical protein
MKRLWVLLLICLLPLQVFAAVLTYAGSVAATDFSASAHASHGQGGTAVKQLVSRTIVVADPAATDEPLHAAVADNGNADDGNSYVDSGEDFSTHAGIGDEPVLMQSLARLPEVSRLAPALRSDDASQPPFLPPAGRPPRA